MRAILKREPSGWRIVQGILSVLVAAIVFVAAWRVFSDDSESRTRRGIAAATFSHCENVASRAAVAVGDRLMLRVFQPPAPGESDAAS